MSLIVEDGSIVPGANTWVGVQGAAAFHAERGGLIPVAEVSSAAVTFAEGGVLTVPSGALELVTAQSIVQLAGAGEEANGGFAFVRSASDTEIVLTWLDTVAEAPGARIDFIVYDQSGWWHAAPSRLEGSLINATSFMAQGRYPWAGSVVSAGQALPWPRKDVRVDLTSGSGLSELAGIDLPSGTALTAVPFPSNRVPAGVVRCELWLSLADIESPLLATIDPNDFLVSKTIGSSGIAKTFGGSVRLRRYPQADAEVARYLAAASSSGAASGPFWPIERV